MNYRHAFHAGNHADVLKHVVLLAALDALQRKPSPLFVLDTHAGRGRYLLNSEEVRKTTEMEAGVMRLFEQPTMPAPVERYLRAVQAHNPVGALLAYPGSPLLVAQALRAEDRLAACELQPDEAAALGQLFAQDDKVAVHARDGYGALKSLLPPRIGATRFGRGLVLIDPPYEAQDAEYPQILSGLREGLVRWPNATCVVWYPIKQRRSLYAFMRKAASLQAKGGVWTAELLVRPDDSPLRLNGSGMLLVNPPWQLDQQVTPTLEPLCRVLGEAGASARLEWLRAAE